MPHSHAVALGLVGLILLSACSTQDTPARPTAAPSASPASTSPAPSPASSASSNPASTSAPTASATASASASSAPDSAARVVDASETIFFYSPTRNIVCALASTSAVCEISEFSFSPPPKPADCEFDYDRMLSVGRTGAGFFVCHSDTAQGAQGEILPYGKSITNGAFSCASSAEAMRCTRTGSAHGFELSRARARVF